MRRPTKAELCSALPTITIALVLGACSDPGPGPDQEDRTPPAVLATTPANGATGVALDAAVSATFSEPIEAGSFNQNTFTIVPGGTTGHSGGAFSFQGTTATFTPDPPLMFGMTWSVTISTGVRDLAGNPMATPHTWTFTTRAGIPANFTKLSAGWWHTCALDAAGVAYCWGGDQFRQLGHHHGTHIPLRVEGGHTFAAITAGGTHSCALTADGAAFCWGWNSNGEVGDGSATARPIPVAVAGGFRFASITAAIEHTCGLTRDGAAYCWGLNDHGQLGDGTTMARATPTRVSGDLRFTVITALGAHSCGVTDTGAAYCWGQNDVGQLGDGTTTDRSVPVAVVGGLRFVAIAAGSSHTCAATEGSAYCWGDNEHGQLGDGTTSERATPVAVVGNPRLTSMTAGAGHTCGLTSAGTAFCWGRNTFGQLGNGAVALMPQPSPVAVAGGTNFTSISAASIGHTCGVSSAGAAYCWGWNNQYGQLGDGTLTNRSTPTPVLR